MTKATLAIDIWTPAGKELPNDDDLPELFAPHLEHITGLCEQGYHSGQVVDEQFSGWWSITRTEGE